MNNIDPNLWGPPAWKFLHYVTISYPDDPTYQDKEKIKNFFISLSNIIPCEKCRVHFAINLNKFPLTDNVLSCRYNLINWLREIHNEVNIRTGKKIYSYDDLMNEYVHNTKSDGRIEIVTIVFLIIILLLIFIYMFSRT